MTVHRVMGIETEYGVSVPGHPTMNAMVTSSHVVNSYARQVGLDRSALAHWDYARENPLRDARGFDMSRADADPSQLTDEPDDELGLANVILTNGARLYVDHAHPEYSSPEVTNPRDATLWDRAGTLIMHRASELGPSFDGSRIKLYKNNVDNKGASYGCHENYLMRRETPFNDIVRGLIPFFVTRQIFTGSGRLGVGQEAQRKEFQISQRADYFEVEVGLETTLKRPLINTRDEPHADPEKHRRLHVIVGDANLSDTATLLKMGSTSLVLALIESGYSFDADWEIVHPVAELTRVSYDTSLSHRIAMKNGQTLRALDIQHKYLEAVRNLCERTGANDEQTTEILQLWESTLHSLEHDLMSCASTIDWVAKYQLMQAYMKRDKSNWSDPRLALIDLQYSDVDPNRGIARALEVKGSLRRIFTDAEVEQAISEPPADTRAYFRGECVRKYPENIAAASWDSVVFDTGGDTLLRVPTLDPLRGTKHGVGEILARSDSARELLEALQAPDQ